MLAFNPHERVTASESLASPYLAPYHYQTDKPQAGSTLNFHEADH